MTQKKSKSETAITAPSLGKMLLEGRAPWEYGVTLATWPLMHFALKNVYRGDGHPVLVFPGLAANDLTTAPLRTFLSKIGYDAHAWHQGINLGPRPGVLEAATQQVNDIFAKTKQPISLVGWSLGGVYAREIAKLYPHAVRNVVTLGTPFNNTSSGTNAFWLYQIANGKSRIDAAFEEALKHSPPVPTTSVFSKSDGIVAWQCSVQEQKFAGAEFENIELIDLMASHFGMGFNAFAWYLLADRLSQPQGKWSPFDARGLGRFIYTASHASKS